MLKKVGVKQLKRVSRRRMAISFLVLLRFTWNFNEGVGNSLSYCKVPSDCVLTVTQLRNMLV